MSSQWQSLESIVRQDMTIFKQLKLDLFRGIDSTYTNYMNTEKADPYILFWRIMNVTITNFNQRRSQASALPNAIVKLHDLLEKNKFTLDNVCTILQLSATQCSIIYDELSKVLDQIRARQFRNGGQTFQYYIDSFSNSIKYVGAGKKRRGGGRPIPGSSCTIEPMSVSYNDIFNIVNPLSFKLTGQYIGDYIRLHMPKRQVTKNTWSDRMNRILESFDKEKSMTKLGLIWHSNNNTYSPEYPQRYQIVFNGPDIKDAVLYLNGTPNNYATIAGDAARMATAIFKELNQDGSQLRVQLLTLIQEIMQFFYTKSKACIKSDKWYSSLKRGGGILYDENIEILYDIFRNYYSLTQHQDRDMTGTDPFESIALTNTNYGDILSNPEWKMWRTYQWIKHIGSFMLNYKGQTARFFRNKYILNQVKGLYDAVCNWMTNDDFTTSYDAHVQNYLKQPGKFDAVIKNYRGLWATIKKKDMDIKFLKVFNEFLDSPLTDNAKKLLAYIQKNEKTFDNSEYWSMKIAEEKRYITMLITPNFKQYEKRNGDDEYVVDYNALYTEIGINKLIDTATDLNSLEYFVPSQPVIDTNSLQSVAPSQFSMDTSWATQGISVNIGSDNCCECEGGGGNDDCDCCEGGGCCEGGDGDCCTD